MTLTLPRPERWITASNSGEYITIRVSVEPDMAVMEGRVVRAVREEMLKWKLNKTKKNGQAK